MRGNFEARTQCPVALVRPPPALAGHLPREGGGTPS